MQEGYKQTEVGLIPKDWSCVRLGNVAKVTKLAGFEFTKYIVYSDQGDIIALRGLNVKNGKLILDDVKYIDNSDFSKLNRSKLFKDDLLFTYVGTVGEAALVDKDDKYYLAPNVALIRLTSQIFPRFCMKQILSTIFHINQIQVQIATSSQPALSMANIRLFNIIVPPLDEQKLIAEALSDIDNMISSLEKLIAKKKSVKQGAMQELLTGKKRLPGFTGEWIEKRIENIAEVGRGRVISHIEISKNIGGKYPVYSSQTTNNGIMGYLRTYDFDGDYITWTTDGINAGTVFHRSGRFNCTNVCGTLKCRDVNTDFVARRLGVETPNYVATNLANPKLMNDVMKRIIITLPPTIEEQTAIASILSDMDNEIEALEQKLEKTHQIKQGMMQQLLTGKIRLV